MSNINFTVKKRLACYVAAICKNYNSIIAAIAVASIGKVMDDDMTVTIAEDDIAVICQQLTAQPEGVTAKYNNDLLTLIEPLLPDYPALAGKLQALMASNLEARTGLETQGLSIIEVIQTAINNN